MAFSNATITALDFEPNTQVRQRPSLLDVSDERQRSLRALATEADARATVDLSLALLWKELALGLCKIVDCYFSDSRCYLLTRATSGQVAPISESAMRVLQAVLNEGGQKVVAIDLDLPASSVAGKARLALDALGACCKPSLTHPLLILAASAERRVDPRCVAQVSFVDYGEAQVRVISIARPDQRLALCLSRAEFAVARYLFEGLCQAQIARERSTSQRTVANQIAAVFRRLGVSGRGEFLLHLLAQPSQGVTPPASPRAQSAD